MARIDFSSNGKTQTRKSKAEQDRSRRVGRRQIKKGAMVVMGTFIPLLSLGLSHTGGVLLSDSSNPISVALGLFAFTLMGCVLFVSLSHLSWSVEDLTRSGKVQSWLLAVTFDLLLVLGELVHVAAKVTDANMIVAIMMVAVCGLSIFLNIWAFMCHPVNPTQDQAAAQQPTTN